MKNVFIAGGGGFVGRNLVARLLRMPSIENILVYDRAQPTKHNPIGGNVGYRIGDVGDLAQLGFWMRGFDTVIHLASNADISRAVSDPGLDFREGTVLTHNILEAARLNNVKRLIYFSGSGIYGDDPWRCWSESDGPLEPISPYGASKLASEAMICAYSFMLGIAATVFRPANLVGPKQTHGVGFDFLRQLRTDPHHLTMLGDGTQQKSYLYIDDAITAVLHVAAQNQDGYDVFNLASEDRMTVNEIATQAALTMECQPEIHRGLGDRGWKGDVPQIRMDCSKLRAAGWSPKWNSTQAMRAALEAMKKDFL